MGSKVVKSMRPGDDGTKGLVKKYGEALLCVRYRVDMALGRRYKTVELVEDSWDCVDVWDCADTGIDSGWEEFRSAGRVLGDDEREEDGVMFGCGEEDGVGGEDIFWFRLKVYVPALFELLRGFGVRRGMERGVWGVKRMDAERLGLSGHSCVEEV